MRLPVHTANGHILKSQTVACFIIYPINTATRAKFRKPIRPLHVNFINHCNLLSSETNDLGGNYMRPGRTQTVMSSYRSPYVSFHAFTWD